MITYRFHDTLHPQPAPNAVHVHAQLPDGRSLQFCLTHEGVIADLYQGDDELGTMCSGHDDMCARVRGQIGQEPYYGDSRLEASIDGGETFAPTEGIAVNARFDEPLELSDEGKEYGAIKYNFYPHCMTSLAILSDGTHGPGETMSYERFASVFMDQRLPKDDAIRHTRTKAPSM